MEEGVFSIGSDPHEGVFRSMSEAEVSLDEMLSLACRQGKQDIVELLLESGANVNHRNKAGNTPLLEACSQGHVSIARLLLDRSADIDAPTETTYDSALTWACTLGNVEIVHLLLDRKAGVEHRTKDGCTALMFAALAGHEKVAKLLLDHQAEINVESDSNKDSPLTFACWKGHQKVVELFLERSADIEHRTKEGFSPLMFAALGGHTQVAQLLLKHQAKVNNPSGSNNDIPLTSACWKGHHQVVYLLLQHDSDIEHRTKDGCTPLMLAAREGHLSVAQLLLNHGAKVNMPSGSENNIPLTLACWKGHRDVVELLLRNVSNIEHQNKAGCTPLMLAAREGHQEATKLLLDSGALINIPSGSNDDTPLTLACWKGHEEVVSLLIQRQSNVNHQTKTGCTPLMEATREGHVGVARLLLEAGADVETPDNYGQSPFFMACWKGHADVAALLLECEANKDCRTKTGITPLFQACRENHVDVVKLLLDYGCNPSTPFPNSRECPLTLAAEKGYVELSQLLLLRSAHVEARTKKGCSPLYLACREGYKEIAVMLAKHGASTEAADLRGTTPLLAAYKNGHFEVVEWLLAHVAHLPSDPECNKALLAPMPSDTDLAPQRSKCIELIMKAKKAREQAALKHAQSLFDQLDAEKEKKESRRAKKRDNRRSRKKKRAGKADAMEAGKEETDSLVEDPEGLDAEEGEESGTLSQEGIPQPPPSPEFVTSSEVSAMTSAPPPADSSQLAQQKKRLSRGKKPGKMGSPEAATTLPMDEGSDSGAEYHDALEFSPTEPPDHHHEVVSLPPSHLPSHSSTNLSDHHPRPPSHDPKPLPLSSHADVSATRYVGQASKRSPQPKAEVTSPASKGGHRANNAAVSAVEQSRDGQVRGNQGAGLEHAPSTGGDRKKLSSSKQVRKVGDREGGSSQWHNQKNRTHDVGVAKTPPPSTPVGPPVVATRGVATRGVASSNSATTTHNKVAAETLASDGKSHSTGATRSKTASKSSSRGHRSNHITPEPALHPRDPSPSSSSVGSSTTESSYSSSAPTKVSMGANWSKTIYSDKQHHHSGNTTPALPGNPSSNQRALYDDKEEYVWSQESDSADWGNDLEDQLLLSSSTDDDKIRSRRLKAAQQTTPTTRPSATSGCPTSQQTAPTTRPSATSGCPTPQQTTAHPSATSTSSYVSSQSWQEVTRPTRTVQLTVSNSLVGRIIGRKGTKINTIQVSSGAHINVSRNIPKSTERLITIKGTQRSISKAQELIDEALSMPDSTVELSASALSDKGLVPFPVSASPSIPSESPSSGGVAPPRQLKRYSDVIPVSNAGSHVGVTNVGVVKRCLPLTKELVRPVSTAGMASVSDAHATVTARATIPAWTTTSSTFASITAATPSPTLQVSASSSPTTLEEQQALRSPPLPSYTPSLADSDEDRLLSPTQASLPSPAHPSLPAHAHPAVAVEGCVDMGSDFPPLAAAPHPRSKSDPQVTCLPGHASLSQPSSEEAAPLPGALTQHSSMSVTSSWPMVAPLALTSDPVNSEATQLETTKLPFAPVSPASVTPGSVTPGPASIPPASIPPASTSPGSVPPVSPRAETDVGGTSSDADGQSHAPPSGLGHALTPVVDNQGHAPASSVATLASSEANVGVVSSLAVGTRPNKSVAVIQPTQQQQSSLPGKFLPSASQSNSTPDLTSIPAPPPSSRGCSYGAIGPPTRRRSLPSRGVKRKPSYAGFVPMENVRENDALNTSAAVFAPPLNHAPNGWPNERRGRSTSVTGHPFPTQSPFSQQGSVYKVPSNPTSQLHAQSDDSLPPPGTPDTPHGENHPMHDQDFSSPGGVYGAIGSSMPGISRTMVSSTMGLMPSHSPLSSPRLSHATPMPLPHHPSDIWIPPFGVGGPRMHHVAQVLPAPPPPLGLTPFPHHTFPRGMQPMHPPSPDSIHMLQRPGMLHQQRPGGGEGMVPNMGMKHGDVYEMGNGNPPYHKRWSVPSFPPNGQPFYHPPHQGQGLEHQGLPWGAWPKQGVKKVVGNMNGQYSGFSDPGMNRQQNNKVVGGALSMGDPWSSHWTIPVGGPGFPSPPPAPGRFNGFSLPPSAQLPKERKGRPRSGRSTSCVTEPWSALSGEAGLDVGCGADQPETRAVGGGANQPEGRPVGTDLLQLMKTLDISSEHMQSLKARKLSLQQLHSMSEEEWRSLKLPVGPRVKLMNAISNIHHCKGDSEGEGQSSEAPTSAFAVDSST